MDFEAFQQFKAEQEHKVFCQWTESQKEKENADKVSSKVEERLSSIEEKLERLLNSPPAPQLPSVIELAKVQLDSLNLEIIQATSTLKAINLKIDNLKNDSNSTPLFPSIDKTAPPPPSILFSAAPSPFTTNLALYGTKNLIAKPCPFKPLTEKDAEGNLHIYQNVATLFGKEKSIEEFRAESYTNPFSSILGTSPSAPLAPAFTPVPIASSPAPALSATALAFTSSVPVFGNVTTPAPVTEFSPFKSTIPLNLFGSAIPSVFFGIPINSDSKSSKVPSPACRGPFFSPVIDSNIPVLIPDSPLRLQPFKFGVTEVVKEVTFETELPAAAQKKEAAKVKEKEEEKEPESSSSDIEGKARITTWINQIPGPIAKKPRSYGGRSCASTSTSASTSAKTEISPLIPSPSSVSTQRQRPHFRTRTSSSTMSPIKESYIPLEDGETSTEQSTESFGSENARNEPSLNSPEI